jgi:hypothetical protein
MEDLRDTMRSWSGGRDLKPVPPGYEAECYPVVFDVRFHPLPLADSVLNSITNIHSCCYSHSFSISSYVVNSYTAFSTKFLAQAYLEPCYQLYYSPESSSCAISNFLLACSSSHLRHSPLLLRLVARTAWSWHIVCLMHNRRAVDTSSTG